jgi:predicted glutamine amidotransferase
MCGIAGVHFKDNAEVSDLELEKLTDALLIGIEPRGDHATGIATMDLYGNVELEKSDTPASHFIFWRSVLSTKVRTVLLHTRWATQGSPTNLLNNHPVQYENAYVVHNGHINNDDDLFKSEDYKRIAEVDSEIIAAVLNYSSLEEVEKIKGALEKLTGGFAIAAFDERSNGRLLLAKGESSPLVLFENSQMYVWASTETAIKDALEYALNYEMKKSETTSFISGEGYVIDGEEKEKFRFDSKYRDYSHNNWNNDSSGAYGTGYQARTWSGSKTLCDGCYKLTSSNDITKKDGEDYCESCLGIYNDFESEINHSRGDNSEVTQEEMDAFNEEHWAVCELVADDNNTSADFVDFMLFGEDEEKMKTDDNLLAIFTKLSNDYDEIMDNLVVKFSSKENEEGEMDKDAIDIFDVNGDIIDVKIIDADTAYMI